MQRIHMSRDEVDAVDGWTTVMSSYPLVQGENSDLRAEVSRHRLKASREDRNVRFVCKWRPDLIPVNYREEGMKEEFILNGIDMEHGVLPTVREWISAGWDFKLHPSVNTSKWTALMKIANESGTPQMYFTTSGTTVQLYSMVADFRSEEYRQICIDDAIRKVEYYGLDGLWLDAKLGWHSHGSPARSTPTNKPYYGGTLYPSPYGPGEFEEGFAEIIRGIAAAGIHPIMVTRPGMPEHGNEPWLWAPDDVQDLLLGEYI